MPRIFLFRSPGNSQLALAFGWCLLSAICAAGQSQTAAATDAFRDGVAPILEQHCVRCHQGSKPKGGLSLVSGKLALEGGESGAAIVPGKPAASPLVDLISGDKPEMPKDAPALSAEQVAAIRAWIAAGAKWPDDLTLADKKVIDTHWWSLEPLVRPAVPDTKSPWVRNPIDAFVLARLRREQLEPAAPADRRTLVRRVYFDLTGLPPAPEEVDSFVVDPDPQAYEKLVDRLLDSPRYGERWARHWLDVVHYGETHGYDKDQPRPNAWPYRDYVIRALNADRPYTRFVEEQLAGDVLYGDTVDGIEALGFISAGPWDLIGHAEVPETKIDGKIARHLDRDDMVGTAMSTLTSLTVQCAQCHDHKFDPITQEDYYSLQAVFAALDRADKPYDADPAVGLQRATLLARQRELKQEQQAVDAQVAKLGGAELAELDKQLAEKQGAGKNAGAVQGVEFGYHSALAADPNTVEWVQVDLGMPVNIRRLVYTPCYDDFNSIGAGFGFPSRFKIEVSDDPKFAAGVQLVVDQSQSDVPNPGTQPQEAVLRDVVGRYVRMTALKLAPRMNDFNFALAELAVYDEANTNLALNKPVTALNSIEAGPRWSTKNLVDGLSPRAVGGQKDVVAELTARRQQLLDRLIDADTAARQKRVTEDMAAVAADLAKLPPVQVVYAGTIHTGSGAFGGTGPVGGKPRKIHILPRGDVRNPGKEVGPGALSRLTALAGHFDLPADHAEGERRAALAHWLTDAKNPLTWRSIVNRVWLYHFGRGIVDTPNDFGRMGQLPTHPELLDWLAVEFRDGGQSLKRLHRLLLTSATYRQSSQISPQAATRDAQNQFYSHMNRRRLEAEAVRDSVLAVSGKLNLTMYGASFKDFVVEKPEHSPHYQYNLFDPENPAAHRRSIYRFIVRSQQQPLLSALDCADPSLMVDKRNQTITPLAALALLNNQLTVTMAKHFAERASQADPQLDGQLKAAFRLAIGRSPTADELAGLSDYARQYGLASACRVILNLNEFVFVD